MAQDTFPLTEVVQSLRAEIVSAVKAAQQSEIVFKLGDVELEFSVVATREGGANGKISFSVLGFGFEVGGDGKIAREKTQTVKITLSPRRKGQEGGAAEVEISGRPGRRRASSRR